MSFDAINILEKVSHLDEITTVKWFLPSKQSTVIVIGYSKESVSNMQYIYELYDYKLQQTTLKGRINNFGVIFLSEYVEYKQEGSFLMLCESKGTRKIIVQNFLIGVTATLIDSIERKEFQEEAVKEWSCVHYSKVQDKIYLLEMSEFSSEESNLYFRVFKEDIQISQYRIICLESTFPKIVFSPQHIMCLNEQQFVVYRQNFEQLCFNIDNMEQFKILGFFYEMILQFKQNSNIFIMSINGTIRPLLEEYVTSCYIRENYLAFLYVKDEEYMVAIFQYSKKKKVVEKKEVFEVSLSLNLNKCCSSQSTKSSKKKGQKNKGSGPYKIVSANDHQILLSTGDIS